MDKIEDFGVHANAYYPLKIEIYKTRLDEQLLDLLWNKYWVATLSHSLVLSVGCHTVLCYFSGGRSLGQADVGIWRAFDGGEPQVERGSGGRQGEGTV
jgi:hypothetical protein